MSHTLTQPEEIDRVLMEMANHEMMSGSIPEELPDCARETFSAPDSEAAYRFLPS